MTTIMVTPIGRQEEASGEAIQLVIHVTEAEVFQLYNQIEVWKSEDLPSGPYEELTADVLSPARLPQGAPNDPQSLPSGPSALLVDKDLRMVAGAVSLSQPDEIEVIFTGADPLTFGDAAAQVTAGGLGRVRAYVTEAGQFVLESLLAGRWARLWVVGGAAAPVLGLPVDEVTYGRDARRTLVEGVTAYSFLDYWGSSAHFYKVRFRNSMTGAVSEFSQVFPGTKKTGLEPTDLSLGQLTLVRADGAPLINQEVRVNMEFTGSLVADKLLAGGDLVKLTDSEGKVEFILPRGQKVTVAVAGTSLVRTITVPDRESFNLFDPDIADDDVFKVQVPLLVMAERRSL
jgi:hypothetical protein